MVNKLMKNCKGKVLLPFLFILSIVLLVVVLREILPEFVAGVMDKVFDTLNLNK